MRIILLRHGETAWNAEGRLQGQGDAPLSERGIEQAKRFAGFARTLAPARVVSSDLGRARKTAELLGFSEAVADPRLREINMGNWTGRLKSDVKAEVGERYTEWRSGNYIPGGGESWSQFRARVTEGLRDCLERCTGDTLAIVHIGVIRAACDAFLSLPASRVMPPDPCTVAILQFENAFTSSAGLVAYNLGASIPHEHSAIFTGKWSD